MTLHRIAIATTVVTGFTGLSWSETRLHRDLGGVTTRVGNVTISTRLNGRTLTAVRVGRSSFYDSNYGVKGISYHSHAGRFDSLLSTRRDSGFVSFSPKRQDWSYRTVTPDGFTVLTAKDIGLGLTRPAWPRGRPLWSKP